MLIVRLAYAVQVRVRLQEAGCHCRIVKPVRYHFRLREGHPVANVFELVSHFYPAHETCVEKDVVQMHRDGVGEVGKVHLILDGSPGLGAVFVADG